MHIIGVANAVHAETRGVSWQLLQAQQPKNLHETHATMFNVRGKQHPQLSGAKAASTRNNCSSGVSDVVCSYGVSDTV